MLKIYVNLIWVGVHIGEKYIYIINNKIKIQYIKIFKMKKIT